MYFSVRRWICYKGRLKKIQPTIYVQYILITRLKYYICQTTICQKSWVSVECCGWVLFSQSVTVHLIISPNNKKKEKYIIWRSIFKLCLEINLVS